MWILLLCLLVVSAGGASAAFAAVSNSDPVAKDNAYRVHKDSVLKKSAPGVLNNDMDPDGDRLAAVRTSSPKHGKVVLRSSGAFVYTPNKGYHGMDSFTYKANDGHGGTDTAKVEITVWPVATPPLARNDVYRMLEDRILTRSAPGVLRNDAEVDGRRLFATKVTDPAHGTLNLNRDGSFVYEPEDNFNGEDSFIYRAADRTGRGDRATVSISVGAVNDAPSFTIGPDQSVDEDPGEQSVSPWATGISAGPGDESGQNLIFEVTENSNPGLFAAGPAISQNGALTYTPADNENGQATIKVRLKDDGGTASGGDDTSGEQQFGITVNPIDDGPSVSVTNNGPIDEGGSATITANATDVDTPGSSFSYEFDCDDNGNFEVGPQAGNTTSCSFDDDGERKVNVHVTDGNGGEASGSTTVTVNNVAPTADGQSVSTDEDTAKTITLTGSDPAGAADPLSFKITSLPEDGTLYEGSGTNAADEIQPSDLPQTLPNNQVTYEPDENFSGTNSFEFKANDGTVDSAAATVSISVAAINDAPTVETESGSASYTEGGQPVKISPLLTVGDVDNSNLVGATVSLTGMRSGDTLSFDDQNGITGNYVSGTGVLTLTGSSSVANYQTALRSVEYSTTSTSPGTSRTVSFQVDDGAVANNLSNTATRDVSISEVNSAPVVTTSSGTTAFNENGPAVAVDDQLTVTDSDSTDLAGATVSITANLASGQDELLFTDTAQIDGTYTGSTGVLTLIGNASVADYQSALRSIRYDNASDTPDTNQRTVSFQVDDGSSVNNLSDTATKDLSVAAVNDAPVLANIESGALAYTENDSATVVTTATTVSDVDSSNFGTLTVDYTAGGTADDRLEIRDEGTGAGQIGVSGSNVTYEGTTIGSFTGVSGTTPLVVTLNANATKDATQALVRNITYRNVSENPSTATRTVRFVLTDGDGGTSAPVTRDVSVTAVNDAPSLDGIEGTAVGYVESVDSPPSESQLTNTLTVADPDNTNLNGATVQLTSNCQSGEDVLVFSTQNNITGSYAACTLTLSGSSSVANYQTALRSVKYRNTSDTPNTATRQVTFKVDDGQAQSHESNAQIRDITVTASNDSPSGIADPFNGSNSALAGVTLAVSTSPMTPNVSISGSVLANDTDPDTAKSALTASAGTSSASSGVVSMNSDGSFTYTPAPGFTGSDTFTYTVHDNDASGDKTATGTVTINVTGPKVWFVNPGGASGNGTSLSPLSSLGPLSTGGTSDSLDGTGDVIFVYSGNATPGGFALENDQRLIGQPNGLTVTDNLSRTFNLVAVGGTNPTITNSSGSGITLASGNTIRNINVGNASGSGISGNNFGILDVGSVGVNTTGQALDLTTGTLSGGLNSVTSGGGTNNILLSGVGTGSSTFSLGSGSLSGASSDAFKVSGGSGSFSYSGNVSQSNNAPLLSVSGGHNGTLTFGTGTLSATNGTGLQFDNADGTYNFNGGTTLSDGDAGVDILNGSSGTFSFGTGTAITNPSGTGFNLSGTTASNASVTYSGNISKTNSGFAIDIDNHDANTITFQTGTLSSTGTSSGVRVQNSNGGTINFNQPTKTLNTGTNAAVTLGSNTNGTMNFGSGGLDVDTTSGGGFSATGGGTVNVTGSGNTIDSTTTGTALNVSNTTIGGSGLTFKSISAGPSSGTGPTNGILLNNTGASGGLTVTGNDGTCTLAGQNTCSGGQIRNTTGAGISLNSTRDVSLTRMLIKDSGFHGIGGTGVTNFTFSTGVVDGAGDADNEDAIYFANIGSPSPNLSGTGLIEHSDINGFEEDGLAVRNDSGTLTLTVNDDRFTNSNRENGILFETFGTSTLTTLVKSSSFSGLASDGIAANANAGTLNFTAQVNNFTGCSAGCFSNPSDNAISVASNGTPTSQANLKFTIQGNTMNNSHNSAIIFNINGNSTNDGRVSNNTINTTTNGLGIDGTLVADGNPDGTNPTTKLLVDGNNITSPHLAGAFLNANDAARLDVTFTNNNLGKPNDISGTSGYWNNLATQASATSTVCSDVRGNTISDGIPSSFGAGRAVGVLKAPGATHTVKQGVSGSTAPATVVQDNNFLTGEPNAVDADSGVTVSGGSCSQPAATPAVP